MNDERSYPASEYNALPCPFCGTKPVVTAAGYATIHCISDECFGPRTTAQYLTDALKQWNTRAPQPVSDAQGRTDCGKPMAYYVEHKLYGVELSLDPPCEDSQQRGWVGTPLYATPVQSSWQPSDSELAGWARNWHWNDCAEDKPVDPSIYFRDMRMLKAFIEKCRSVSPPSTEGK